MFFKDKFILLGDFIVRVGCDYDIWGNVFGYYGVGKVNFNGMFFLGFCVVNEFVIMNIIF